MTTYDPDLHRDIVGANGESNRKFWPVNKFVILAAEAGLISLVKQDTEPGDTTKVWLDVDEPESSNGTVKVYSSGSWIPMTPALFAEHIGAGGGGGGGGTWGSITGTLSSQTDLQTALDALQPLDSDLTAIAALTTAAAGRSTLELADPNADRIAFWDDSAGKMDWLTAGSGLSISGTTITATGGGTGDVTAASSIPDNEIVRGDGGSKGVQGSGITIDDTKNVSGVAALSATTIELGHASDTTLARSGAGDITIEGNAVYRAGGTDVPLADGGTGASLTDPNADRILFWDDSAGAVTWLQAGSGLSISGTTITASGGGGSFSDNTGITDENGNEQLWFQTTASAVNYWEITNAATGNRPLLQAQGSDTNVGGTIGTKGTGALRFQINGTDELELTDSELAPVTTGGLNLGSYTARFSNLHLGSGNGVIMGPSSGYVAFSGDATNNRFELYNNAGTCVTFRMTPGTSTVPPFEFQSGTNMTTPGAGVMEFDGTCLYGTVDAGNRGVIPCINFVRLDAARALTNSTAEQAFFDAANDTLTLETGTYFMTAYLSMSSMSATSGNAAFDILGAGTAVLGSVQYQTWGSDAAANATAAAIGGAHMTQGQTGANSVTAGTALVVGIAIQGSFEVTTAGTIIPSISLVTAAAANADAGSYFMVWRMGSTTAVAVGQWG